MLSDISSSEGLLYDLGMAPVFLDIVDQFLGSSKYIPFSCPALTLPALIVLRVLVNLL